MKANAIPLLAIFEKKIRLEVPLFQRQYVWNQEHQWEPLWEDIERKFVEALVGRKDAPVHFLGAMVLDQKQTPLTHVERRQVIDGQQRLTTFQLFLAAFRDWCREQSCEELAKESDGFILNKGLMAQPDVDKFKVWPTQADRAQFTDVITANSRKALETKHPLKRRKYARTHDSRPRMIEAYIFFHNCLGEFFLGTASEPPIGADQPLEARLDECLQTLKSTLQVVAIDLEQGDDAQVIFETLNARGEPLLPADLLRNYIFLRAARNGEPQEALYDQYWRAFDEPFWREPVRQGRLLRPRSDLFIHHFLTSRQTEDIPVKHLYVEYKSWIDNNKPWPTVAEELAALAKQGNDFRRILKPAKDDILFPLATFLDHFDVRTAYPLLLHLLDCPLNEAAWQSISGTLESYLVRRAVCGLTTKNLNRTFMQMTRALRRDGTSPESFHRYLAELSGDAAQWPRDAAFSDGWLHRDAYHTLQNQKLVPILRRLNDTFHTTRSEAITIHSPLTVEHVLPQRWLDHWPLPDGSPGLTEDELEAVDEEDHRALATRRRNRAVHTMGNLTLVTGALNSAISNSSWKDKRPALLRNSLLPINLQLVDAECWDEAAIVQRGKDLLARALKLWSGPVA